MRGRVSLNRRCHRWSGLRRQRHWSCPSPMNQRRRHCRPSRYSNHRSPWPPSTLSTRPLRSNPCLLRSDPSIRPWLPSNPSNSRSNPCLRSGPSIRPWLLSNPSSLRSDPCLRSDPSIRPWLLSSPSNFRLNPFLPLNPSNCQLNPCFRLNPSTRPRIQSTPANFRSTPSRHSKGRSAAMPRLPLSPRRSRHRTRPSRWALTSSCLNPSGRAGWGRSRRFPERFRLVCRPCSGSRSSCPLVRCACRRRPRRSLARRTRSRS